MNQFHYVKGFEKYESLILLKLKIMEQKSLSVENIM